MPFIYFNFSEKIPKINGMKSTGYYPEMCEEYNKERPLKIRTVISESICNLHKTDKPSLSNKYGFY